jgi:membrane protein
MTDAKRRLRRVLAHVPGALPLARLTVATIRISLRYRVTGLASEAGFFALLSLPPLVLGLFGGLGYLGEALGEEAVTEVRRDILDYSSRFLTPEVIDSILGPTVDDVLNTGRADLLSIGFVLSLWSGSRALNVFVDTISIMYGQSGVRGIVQTRALSFSLYVVALVLGIVTIPLVLLGPTLLGDILPTPWDALTVLYWPLVTLLTVGGLTSLYHVSTPRRSPWARDVPGAALTLLIWALASFVVRGSVAASLGGSSIYGPLSAPIVILIWLYALAIAVLIGAALNAAIRQLWPHAERPPLHERVLDRARQLRPGDQGRAWDDPFEGYAFSEEDTLGFRSLRRAARRPLTPMASPPATDGAGEASRPRAGAEVDR